MAVSGRTRTLTALLTLPPTLAHEVVHAVAAAPFAETVGIVLDPRGARAECVVDWRDDPPAWGVWLAAYAPALIGGVVGLVGAGLVATGGVPDSPRGLLLAGMLAVWWAIFAWPSAADRDHSLAGDSA